MAFGGYPKVDNTAKTEKIVFPSIVQNGTDMFIHNWNQTVTECNTHKKPLTFTSFSDLLTKSYTVTTSGTSFIRENNPIISGFYFEKDDTTAGPTLNYTFTRNPIYKFGSASGTETKYSHKELQSIDGGSTPSGYTIKSGTFLKGKTYAMIASGGVEANGLYDNKQMYMFTF